jgi:hypothetical protein
VSAFLLKDCSPNESLADQSLRAAFARFTGADDIASASDSRLLAPLIVVVVAMVMMVVVVEGNY